ncbi:MAG: cytochrome bc complex cytochrome b subunit [Chloroflexota bacterium]|nr:cytochrome bc complex cytochrome b subunit [Chloroflexota bacterium]
MRSGDPPGRGQSIQRSITPPDQNRGWLEERLELKALMRKYGRKAFPVHTTFFLGEMALFSFIILALTGIYLGFVYVPSNADVSIEGETLPEAYASVLLIESIPVGSLFRNTHHWAAHVMIASILLHLFRIFFTGTYRKPREVNWVIGVVLLGLSLMAGFVGYALPYDSYAVVATGIGFSIARSIPWIGEFAAELFFGGAFPTLGSLARLYTIHVFIVPALLAAIMSLHLLLVVKQKHTQPGYARPLSEPGKVLGVPLIPYQALLAGQLFFLMFGALFLLSAFIPPHPLEEYGPPQPATPDVKPDWYLLWIYGFLKIIPSWVSFEFLGATISPNFLGGLLFPALIFGVLTLAPWMDRTNRRVVRRFEYLEPVQQSPIRTALGIGMLTFLGTLFLAAYYDEIGMSLVAIWLVVIIAPIVAGALTAVVLKNRRSGDRFDPQEEREVPVEAARFIDPNHPLSRAPRPVEPDLRELRSRDNVVTILHEMGELASQVRQTDNANQLREILDRADQLRESLAESNEELQDALPAERTPTEENRPSDARES